GPRLGGVRAVLGLGAPLRGGRPFPVVPPVATEPPLPFPPVPVPLVPPVVPGLPPVLLPLPPFPVVPPLLVFPPSPCVPPVPDEVGAGHPASMHMAARKVLTRSRPNLCIATPRGFEVGAP